MDTYCWIHSTFSVPNKKVDTRDMPHAGVAPPSGEILPSLEMDFNKLFDNFEYVLRTC
jgi:hypothetical protein